MKRSKSWQKPPAPRVQMLWPRTLNTWLIRGRWSKRHLRTRRSRQIQRWPIYGCRNFYPADWTACTSSSSIMWALSLLWMRTASARFVIRHRRRNCARCARAHGNRTAPSWMRRSWAIVNMTIRWSPPITIPGCVSFALADWKRVTLWNWSTRSRPSGALLPTTVISASWCCLPAEARRS